jgi:hypothetical protein
VTDTYPEAQYDPDSQLGCAQSYSAAVHWRGGARVYIPTNLIGAALSAVSWDRRLNETSAAKIVIGKSTMTDECCGLLGQIYPWCHELTIYRDTALVWQGPVSVVTEDQTSVTVEALDVTAWLGRLVNTHSLNHPTTAVDITSIAKDAITLNLLDSALSTPTTDWPGMVPYLSVASAGVAIKLNRRSVWSDTVLNIVSNLGQKGFEWTAVGRRMVLRPPATSDTRARARLTPEDLPGGIQVARDGTDAATRVYATSQTDTEDGITVSTALAAASAICGRIDQVVKDQPRVDVETDAQEAARHKALQDGRDADIDASRNRRDAAIKAERTDANNDITVIDNRSNTSTSQDRHDAQARRKQEASTIDTLRRTCDNEVKQIRRQYEDDLAASDAAIAAQQVAAVTAVLLAEAKQALKGRWPAPVGITVQDGAQLSTTAPVTLLELVPGERLDVATVGYCQAITQAMRLSKVTGTWGQSGEAIGVSLVPMAELAAVDS